MRREGAREGSAASPLKAVSLQKFLVNSEREQGPPLGEVGLETEFTQADTWAELGLFFKIIFDVFMYLFIF